MIDPRHRPVPAPSESESAKELMGVSESGAFDPTAGESESASALISSAASDAGDSLTVSPVPEPDSDTDLARQAADDSDDAAVDGMFQAENRDRDRDDSAFSEEASNEGANLTDDPDALTDSERGHDPMVPTAGGDLKRLLAKLKPDRDHNIGARDAEGDDAPDTDGRLPEPRDLDTDGDGVPDRTDPDDDGDGVPDVDDRAPKDFGDYAQDDTTAAAPAPPSVPEPGEGRPPLDLSNAPQRQEQASKGLLDGLVEKGQSQGQGVVDDVSNSRRSVDATNQRLSFLQRNTNKGGGGRGGGGRGEQRAARRRR